MPTGKGVAATCKLPLAPSFERAGAPRGDIASVERSLAGNSLNDEQRSNDLSDPSSH